MSVFNLMLLQKSQILKPKKRQKIKPFKIKAIKKLA